LSFLEMVSLRVVLCLRLVKSTLAWPAWISNGAVEWSGELRDLNFDAVHPEDILSLSSGFAEEVAGALRVSVADVLDADGQPGQVTLRALASGTLATITETTTVTSTTTTTTTVTSTTKTSTSTTTQAPATPLQPMRGIAYGALPCLKHGCGEMGRPSEDMLQVGYRNQWGASGRDDIGMMARLGANVVRLYHSIGMHVQKDHGEFLDYAQKLGMNVMPGYHTESANEIGKCPEFDCFQTWKLATLDSFEHGFRKGSDWHPAIAVLVLLNEPDFFETAPKCQPSGSWCRVKAALSAMDGVLAAEKEAGVAAGRVRLTVTWSFAMRTSIDGKVTGPATYGFQDIVAGIQNPQLAGYNPRTPRADLESAFRSRWIHGLNTQSPWNFVNGVVSKQYEQFLPIPWFIGEYGANGQDETVIRADLESMDEQAKEGGAFWGAIFFQFQTTYWKGGAEQNFGLFGLQEKTLGATEEVCDNFGANCQSWPVHCLTEDLPWLPGTKKYRARAVSIAWKGIVEHSPPCSGRRLSGAIGRGTQLFCQVRGHTVVAEVDMILGSESFNARISTRTHAVLGWHSSELRGGVSLSNTSAIEVFHAWKTWVFIGVSAALLVAGGLGLSNLLKWGKGSPSSGSTAREIV